MNARYTIPVKGTATMEWQVGNEFWAERSEGGVLGGDLTVSAGFERGMLVVRIAGTVVVSCDRCLEDCSIPVDFEGRLAVKASEEDLPFEGDILWVRPGDTEVDLAQYIYESVVLSLPLQRVHPEDVHGQPLCNPAMLERFKIVTEEEFNNKFDVE